MARPSRPFGGQETISRHSGWHKDEIPGVVGVREVNRWDAMARQYVRVPNRALDPHVYFIVLTELMNIRTDVIIRASNFTEWLNENRSQYIWDPVTVGKVLRDICDSFEGKLGSKNGFLEKVRDSRGMLYVVKPNHETIPLVWKVASELHELVLDTRKAYSQADMSAGPLYELPSLRGEWVDLAPDA